MTTRAQVEALFGEDEYEAWMVWLVQQAVLIRDYSHRKYSLRRTLNLPDYDDDDEGDVW